MDGCFPKHLVDHIDRNRLNNRYKNLRIVTNQHNLHNSGNCKNNTSGIRGVCFDKKRQKWFAQIKFNYKASNLGVCDDFAEAVCLRYAVEQCLGFQGEITNSPAYLYVQKMLSN